MSELTLEQLRLQEEHALSDEKTHFGFWVFIMTDCLLFASLFATYAVLHVNTYGGPGAKELFSLPFVFTETLILLTSSYTCGLALLAARKHNKKQVARLLAVTFLLGVAFLSLELTEFRHLSAEGNNWQRSGFLSAFFTLVSTHGLHITSGLIWVSVLMWQLLQRGFTRGVMRRLSMFAVFWHFLDIVWIFIFTVVYLLGVA